MKYKIFSISEKKAKMAKQWISQQNFSKRNVLLLFGKRVGNWKLLAVAQVSNKMCTSAEGTSIYIFITYECNSK